MVLVLEMQRKVVATMWSFSRPSWYQSSLPGLDGEMGLVRLGWFSLSGIYGNGTRQSVTKTEDLKLTCKHARMSARV